MLPIDLQRLILRIDRLQRTATHGWDPADELEFKNRLPTSRDERRRLPSTETLRKLSPANISREDERHWLGTCLQLECIIHRNDPRNPRRMMRDMARGRFPGLH